MKVKDKLIDQINSIENEQLMHSISSMLSSLNENGVFVLSDTIISELEERSERISKGEFKTHEEVKKRFKV